MEIESIQEKNQPIIIKNISIDEAKNSLQYTYRKSKEGLIEVTGFDVKVYGDAATIISSKADQLIKLGIQRMQNPTPKGDF